MRLVWILGDQLLPDHPVTFTQPNMSTEELNLYYNSGDLIVNLTSNEGFGLATCEGMRAGLPIVVNVTGGLQDQCGFELDGKILDENEIGRAHV